MEEASAFLALRNILRNAEYRGCSAIYYREFGAFTNLRLFLVRIGVEEYLTETVPMDALGVLLLLTEKMRRHVETNWKRVPKQQLKTYRSRLRNQAVAALLDLALVAEREPEDQLQQIFTPDTVEILIQALIGNGCEAIHARHHEIARLMLNAAYKRLQILIDTDYRPMVVEPLNRSVALLTMIPAPKQPRQIAPDTVNDQREKTQRQRRRIMRDHLSRQILEKHD